MAAMYVYPALDQHAGCFFFFFFKPGFYQFGRLPTALPDHTTGKVKAKTYRLRDTRIRDPKRTCLAVRSLFGRPAFTLADHGCPGKKTKSSPPVIALQIRLGNLRERWRQHPLSCCGYDYCVWERSVPAPALANNT